MTTAGQSAASTMTSPAFVTEGDAEVTAIIVTYNSVGSIGSLLDDLRAEATDTALRVVVVDNDSTDGTVDEVSDRTDVVLVEARGNVGYAAAINRGMVEAKDSRAVLVLNPDASVVGGCVKALRAGLDVPGVVAVVPMLTEADGSLSHSLRREPRLLASAVDTFVGSFFPDRPRMFSETIRDPRAYQNAHDVEWATGAAVMIDTGAAREAGEWDERFFLYSEETDYFRRLRASGRIRYVPDAQIVHTGAGSGSSQALQDLLVVNKIRYVEKYHGIIFATIFRTLAAASEAIRARSPQHRATLAVVLDKRRWNHLPRATYRPHPHVPNMGAVIVPAHNEAAVIGRTLSPLSDAARSGVFDVIVVCNGCTDNTAEVARAIPGVRVLEIETASKIAAMNAGDLAATCWPRMYLDADIRIEASAVVDVLATLSRSGVLGARPAAQYDSSRSSTLVRRYYRARSSIGEFDRHLWGAGCYGMSETGHAALGCFPDAVADDVVVDGIIPDRNKAFVDTAPVVVSVPRTSAALVNVLARNYSGNREVTRTTSAGRSLVQAFGAVRGPSTMLDAVIYCSFALAGRHSGRRLHERWARDETSRR